MSPVAPGFGAMPASKLKRILNSLGYQDDLDTKRGSHVLMRCPGRPSIRWAFHNREVAALEVRRVLVQQAGLNINEAKEAVRRG